MTKPHIWLRAETKPQEQRTALTPDGVSQLLAAGFKVTVEKSTQSIFADAQYQQLDCDMAEAGSWIDAPADTIILGLKELPEASFPLKHKHIYFAHCYKQQAGAEDIMKRFVDGNGELYDLEFLLDDNGRRIAAFGYWAGFAGAALAVLAWANKCADKQVPLQPVKSLPSKELLIEQVAGAIDEAGSKPSVMVMGAKGRSGTGAVDLAKALGLETIEWDMAETQKGGPFTEINQADVFVNCVLVNADLPPFLTLGTLSAADRKLSVIADVSCDPYGSYNPLPIYNSCTTFNDPILNILDDDQTLDLIAIDHLPSLLPKESSEDYGAQLVPYLLTLDDVTKGVWGRAMGIFKEHTTGL